MKLVTVREAVNQASKEIGLTQFDISTALGSADQDINQMTALLTAVADEVLAGEPYEETLGDGNWLADAISGAQRSAPMKDTDVILFDGRLCIAGLKFRFLKAKGLEFGEEMRDFATRMNHLAAKMNARVLDLDLEASIEL